ncbi:hypothetical protein AB4Y42_02170 [Paraburkholderia sp. EG286B]|uniref:hypothetical protein n=1 Tax=Paraburkholderia sp. EG286B TaxID=3237011 RepID=UPI0034D318AB
MSLGCAAASAHAQQSWFQLEAGIGGSAYQHGPNGLWYQDGFDHRLDLTAPSVKFGVTGNIWQRGPWGIDYHVDYYWLGTIHTDAKVPSAKTNTTSGQWIGPDLVGVNAADPCSGPCNNLSDFMGSGHDMGFALTLEPHYTWNGITFGVDAGPYIHRSTWSEDVANWYANADAQPIDNHVKWRPVWALGWTVGASIIYRNFAIEYAYFRNQGNATNSNPYNPIWKSTHVLMGTYRY